MTNMFKKINIGDMMGAIIDSSIENHSGNTTEISVPYEKGSPELELWDMTTESCNVNDSLNAVPDDKRLFSKNIVGEKIFKNRRSKTLDNKFGL